MFIEVARHFITVLAVWLNLVTPEDLRTAPRAVVPGLSGRSSWIPRASNLLGVYTHAHRSASMALRKQKKYNWKETNLAYFGSELEKQARQQNHWITFSTY